MPPTRPPAHRNFARQPIPGGSAMSGAADWNSDASVLPEQFFNPQASFFTGRPVAGLLRAVLEDALSCFQNQFLTERRRVQREAQEAKQWFWSEDSHWPFSFVSICAVLGLEPEAIRQRLKRWSHSHAPVPQKKMRRRAARQSHRVIGRLS